MHREKGKRIQLTAPSERQENKERSVCKVCFNQRRFILKGRGEDDDLAAPSECQQKKKMFGDDNQ